MNILTVLSVSRFWFLLSVYLVILIRCHQFCFTHKIGDTHLYREIRQVAVILAVLHIDFRTLLVILNKFVNRFLYLLLLLLGFLMFYFAFFNSHKHSNFVQVLITVSTDISVI